MDRLGMLMRFALMLLVVKRQVNTILVTLLDLKYNPENPYYAKPSESQMKINFMLKSKKKTEYFKKC